MGHQHNHNHNYAQTNRAFALGVGLNAIYILVEVGFGLAVGSLALLADAGHNLSDVLGLLLAWGAHYLSGLKPTEKMTYGWRSSTILASLFNALILILALGAMAWEAIQRLQDPAPVPGMTVLVVAGIGVVINTVTALLFMSGRKEDLNVKGAFLHMAADAGVSLGVMIGGGILLFRPWYWLDSVLSLLIVAVILIGTWGLLRDSLKLALQAVPPGIDLNEVREYLQQLEEVREVHDLHIWGMSTTETALTVHLVTPGVNDPDALLERATHELHDHFGIEHVTIQLEQGTSKNGCPRAAPGAV